MAIRTLPGIGLTGGFPDEYDGWGEAMRINLERLSVLTQLSVLSRVTPPPTSGMTEGMIYIVPTGDLDANKLEIYDEGSWKQIEPQPGWVAFVQDEGLHVFYDGSGWTDLGGGGGAGGSTISVATYAANRVAEGADFSGSKVALMNLAGANTLTVPSGLSGTEPLLVVQYGEGQTEIVAGSGVTVQSAGARKKLRARYSSASLIPLGAETYLLVGDLSA